MRDGIAVDMRRYSFGHLCTHRTRNFECVCIYVLFLVHVEFVLTFAKHTHKLCVWNKFPVIMHTKLTDGCSVFTSHIWRCKQRSCLNRPIYNYYQANSICTATQNSWILDVRTDLFFKATAAAVGMRKLQREIKLNFIELNWIWKFSDVQSPTEWLFDYYDDECMGKR